MMSERRIQLARQALGAHNQTGMDVVALGSLARREVTGESDFDYLVLAASLPDDPETATSLLKQAQALRTKWMLEEGRQEEVTGPGASGVFGRAVGAFELIDQIGLQQDTNHSLTRRMLLLEESVSLMDDSVYAAVMRATLNRYLLVGNTRPDKVPRFLLNDVVRYWRTITVDYQAKARAGQATSGLRYVKLIIPRKVVFAGTVMSLLLCGLPGFHSADADDLMGQFRRPSLSRLAQGFGSAPPNVQEALREVLAIMDEYLACSADSDWRAAIKTGKRGAEGNPLEFIRACEQGDQLQEALETLFFEWDLLGPRSRRLLAF